MLLSGAASFGMTFGFFHVCFAAEGLALFCLEPLIIFVLEGDFNLDVFSVPCFVNEGLLFRVFFAVEGFSFMGLFCGVPFILFPEGDFSIACVEGEEGIFLFFFVSKVVFLLFFSIFCLGFRCVCLGFFASAFRGDPGAAMVAAAASSSSSSSSSVFLV